jgi:hypothetical protein
MSKKTTTPKNEKGALVAVWSTKSSKNGKVYTGFSTGKTTTVSIFEFDDVCVATTTTLVKRGTKIALPKGVKIEKGWVRKA